MLQLFLLVLLIFFDQASKYIIRSWGGFYICNAGVAFGIYLPVWLILIITVALVFLFGFLILNLKFEILSEFFNFKFKNFKLISNFKFQISNYSAIFIFSGAISNIIDRLHFGCIIDFIDLKFWPVFNLADIFITTGAIIILCQFKNLEIKKLFRN